jgi:hypothetical protein
MVQRSYNKRTKEFKSTKAGYWRTVPISVELKWMTSSSIPEEGYREISAHRRGES